MDSGSNDAINTGTNSNAPATGVFERIEQIWIKDQFMSSKFTQKANAPTTAKTKRITNFMTIQTTSYRMEGSGIKMKEQETMGWDNVEVKRKEERKQANYDTKTVCKSVLRTPMRSYRWNWMCWDRSSWAV